MDFTAKGKWLTEDGVEWLPVTIEVYDCDKEEAKRRLKGLTDYNVILEEREFGKTTTTKTYITDFDFHRIRIDSRTLKVLQ